MIQSPLTTSDIWLYATSN